MASIAAPAEVVRPPDTVASRILRILGNAPERFHITGPTKQAVRPAHRLFRLVGCGNRLLRSRLQSDLHPLMFLKWQRTCRLH